MCTLYVQHTVTYWHTHRVRVAYGTDIVDLGDVLFWIRRTLLVCRAPAFSVRPRLLGCEFLVQYSLHSRSALSYDLLVVSNQFFLADLS